VIHSDEGREQPVSPRGKPEEPSFEPVVSFKVMPPAEERESSERVRRINVLLPGLYAWAATVLYPASLRGVGMLARWSAALALLPLLVGIALGKSRPLLSRSLSLHGFLAACALTWILLGDLLAVDHLDPLRAALGAIGWVLFAFAWGASREPELIPEDDPRALPGEPLAPRGTLPAGATAVLTVAVMGALVPLLFAWRVTRPSHALLAHAAAVAAAVGLVSSGAEIAVNRGKWAPIESASRRVTHAIVPLAALTILLLVGVIELFSS